MMPSKYREAFEHAAETCKDDFEIIGDGLLVEEIPKEEIKSKGGIFMPTNTKIDSIDGLEANRPCFVRVLAVGEGYFNDKTDGTVPLNCRPGDIILVPKLSVKWLSVFGNLVSTGGAQIGLVSETSMQLRFPGDAAYDRFFSALQEKITVGEKV